MRIPAITIIALLICTLPPAAGAATPVVNQRICTDTDVAGTFNMVNFKETPKGQETAWFQDYHYHYIQFKPDHTYAFVASLHRMAAPEDLRKAILFSESEGSRVIERKYTLDDTGLLNLYLDDQLDYSYRCTAMTKNSNAGHEGDILLIGYTRRGSEIEKTFRRWPPE